MSKTRRPTDQNLKIGRAIYHETVEELQYLDVEDHFELKSYMLGDFKVFMGTMPVSKYRRIDLQHRNGSCEVMVMRRTLSANGYWVCWKRETTTCPVCTWQICDEHVNNHGCGEGTV